MEPRLNRPLSQVLLGVFFILSFYSRKEKSMSWQNNLRSVSPYIAGEQPELTDMIKLNTNENPYPVSYTHLRAHDTS